MDLADRHGLVVIDESPAVGMRTGSADIPTYCDERVNDKTLAHHLQVMRELIQRDKNHPCVVMWSVANEPIGSEEKADEYFRKVIAETRRLDSTRPVTVVCGDINPDTFHIFKHVDVLCINRYHSWYADSGHLEIIETQTVNELTPWFVKFKKPILLSEYGADTIAGLHAVAPEMFTEEYQCAFLKNFHKAIDTLDFVIGEHVWNFADFATKQGFHRVMGNKKGIFTRQRHPKMAAHLLRSRWTAGVPKELMVRHDHITARNDLDRLTG